MYTKHDGKYRVYVLGDGKDNVKDEVDIRFYKTESELLKEFLRYWIDVKPTMINVGIRMVLTFLIYIIVFQKF